MLSENKMSKYLLYALGEIVLVVIGILIALQINKRHENSQNEQRKIEMLQAVHHEFELNKDKLALIATEHRKCYANCKELISLFPIDTEQLDLDTLSTMIRGTYGNWTFEPLQTRIEFLVGSPDFHFIKDTELQTVLLSWESVFEDYQEDEQRAIDYNFNILYPYTQKHFSYTQGLSDPRLDISILGSPEFENTIIRRKFSIRDIIDSETKELEVLIATIDRIIVLTEPFAKKTP